MVERGQYRDAFVFRHCDDRRVNESESEVRVLLDERDRVFIIGHGEVDHLNVTRCNKTKKSGLLARPSVAR